MASQFKIGQTLYAKSTEVKRFLPGKVTYIHPKGHFLVLKFKQFKESFFADQVIKEEPINMREGDRLD